MSGPAFRDVTVFHAEDAQGWVKYLLQNFHNGELSLRIDTMDLSRFDFDHPPEVAVALQESHVVLLFITAALLDYMEKHDHWLSDMLEKVDSVLTTVVGIYLNVDLGDIEGVCATHNYRGDEWELMELLRDGSNICSLVTKVLDTRDKNFEKGKRRKSINKRKESVYPHASADIVPSTYNSAGEKIVIIFEEEVAGTVTLQFRGIEEETQATVVNPYNVVFTAPELTEENMAITVKINGEPKYDVAWSFRNAIPNFTSVEFLRQATGAKSVTELDELLADKFQSTLSSAPESNDVLGYLGSSASASRKSKELFPTLLHMAAAFGLRELVSCLLSAPCAAAANRIENCDDMLPADLAKQHGHNDLADFMHSYQEAEECVEIFDNYVKLYAPESAVKYDEVSVGTPKVGRPVLATGQQMPPLQLTGQASAQGGAVAEAPRIPPRQTPQEHAEVNYEDIEDNDGEGDLYITPDTSFVPGSMGSRGQAELIEIQKEVKQGNLYIPEAERLFAAWKERYATGNTCSFKTKQEGLATLRKEFQKTLQTLQKVNERNENEAKRRGRRSSSTSENKDKGPSGAVSTLAITVGAPFSRSQTSKLLDSPGDRVSNASFASAASFDSGRASNISQVSFSSEMDETESDVFQIDLRKKRYTGFPSPHSSWSNPEEKRKSSKDTYLDLLQADLVKKKTDGGPPPLPPRPQKKPMVFSKPKTGMIPSPNTGKKPATLPRKKQ